MSEPRPPQITVGEMFAGIGGFGLAAERAGCEVRWASEIDDFATRVYAVRFPNVRQLGDVTTIAPKPVDCITAGFPCQDLSVAGKRKGLVGERSGLFWHIIRVAQRLRPRWLLLENVPGLLSSHHGRDFETVLAALDNIGYGVAWRVLDAQFFGVPQRRRRVFIVGHLGGPCPAEVLFEPEGVSGHIASSQETGAGVTQALTRSLGAGGADDNDAQGGLIVIEDAGRKMSGDSRVGLGISEGGPCYTHQAGSRHAVVPIMAAGTHGANGAGIGRAGDPMFTLDQTGAQAIARPLTATSYKGHDEDTDTIVTHSLRAEGADASEDGTGRGTPLVAATVRTHNRNNSDPTTEVRALMFGDPRRHDIRGVHRGDMREKPCLNATNNDLLLETRPRRLTPRECERLQGFPDDWTLIEGASASARYRALGNAVAVPVVEWILRRLVGAGAGQAPPASEKCVSREVGESFRRSRDPPNDS